MQRDFLQRIRFILLFLFSSYYRVSPSVGANERLVLRKTIPTSNEGSILVFEKLSPDADLKEEWCNQKIKKLTDENRTLEVLLKTKSGEIAQLDRQFRQKLVNNVFQIGSN